MVDEETLKEVRKLVLENFYFPEKPKDIMWTDEDSEPYEDLDTLFCDDNIDRVLYGCTKIVLFPDWLEDFVIKIPFVGRRFHDEYHPFRNVCYKDILGYTTKSSWNHCELEELVYKCAVKCGIADMFCGTYFVAKISGFPVYISEKSGYAIDEDRPHYPSKDAQLYTATKTTNNHGVGSWNMPADMEPETLGLFYDSWGQEKTDKLVKFLLDNSISDCHNGNVAFKDGKIRIIDYPGFYK